jgi:hypothetical protein
LSGGIATGNKGSGIRLLVYPSGVSGSADNTATAVFDASGDGGLKMAFWGQTKVAQQTLAAYTTVNMAVPFSGIDNTQAGVVYATVADLNSLRAAYEALRASYDDMRTKIVTSTLMAA